MADFIAAQAPSELAAPGFLGFGENNDQPDPNDPNNWSGDQRSNFLGSLGYRWVSGSGPSAVWQAPNGSRVSEGVALDAALGTYEKGSPVEASKPQSASEPQKQQLDANGQAWTWNPSLNNGQGDWQRDPRFDKAATGAGGGMTAGQSAQIAQAQRQLDEQIRVNNETIARNAKLDALAEQQQNWLQQKEALARSDRKDELAQTAQQQSAALQVTRDRLTFDTQQAQAANQRAYDQMQQQAAMFNAQGATDVAKFNAQQGLATEQANNQAEAQRSRDLLAANETLGTLGQDTGNRGKFAAFATANRGFGQDNKNLATTSFIDTGSVQPLEGAIGARNQIEASPARPYSYTPITFNPLATMNMSPGPLTQATQPAPAGNGQNTNTGVFNPGTGQQLNAGQVAQDNAATRAIAASMGLPAAEHGGMIKGAFMAGDSSDGKENAEIVIPLGAGGAMVVSTKGMAPERIKAMKKQMVKFATGGIFDQIGDAPLSQQFLGEASTKFRKDTPWEGLPGFLPSPVYGSSPGFNPLLNQLLASGRALEQGIPTEYSNFLTAKYAPNTIRGISGVSRS